MEKFIQKYQNKDTKITKKAKNSTQIMSNNNNKSTKYTNNKSKILKKITRNPVVYLSPKKSNKNITM